MEKFNALSHSEMILVISIFIITIYLVSVIFKAITKKPEPFKIDNVQHIEFSGPNGTPVLVTRIHYSSLQIKDDRQIYIEENGYDKSKMTVKFILRKMDMTLENEKRLLFYTIAGSLIIGMIVGFWSEFVGAVFLAFPAGFGVRAAWEIYQDNLIFR